MSGENWVQTLFLHWLICCMAPRTPMSYPPHTHLAPVVSMDNCPFSKAPALPCPTFCAEDAELNYLDLSPSWALTSLGLNFSISQMGIKILCTSKRGCPINLGQKYWRKKNVAQRWSSEMSGKGRDQGWCHIWAASGQGQTAPGRMASLAGASQALQCWRVPCPTSAPKYTGIWTLWSLSLRTSCQ